MPARPSTAGACRLLMPFILALLPLLMPARLGAHTVTREKVISALPRLEALAQQAVDRGAVPGLAIAVVLEDEVVYLKGFGLRQTGKPV